MSSFERLALIAEPLPSSPFESHVPIGQWDDNRGGVPYECGVDEHGYHYGPNAHTSCVLDTDCQGARICDAGVCTGYAGAACCAHASPGACVQDGYCSTCNPHGGEGHTFRMRSKQYPTMYVVPSERYGPMHDGSSLVFSDSPSAS